VRHTPLEKAVARVFCLCENSRKVAAMVFGVCKEIGKAILFFGEKINRKY